MYYVDIDATGNSNGLNWVDAYVDLKLALDDINANMPCGIVEIWVAEGWYYPSDGTGLLPRRKAIRLYDNFYVYGGFAGGETSRINRDSHH